MAISQPLSVISQHLVEACSKLPELKKTVLVIRSDPWETYALFNKTKKNEEILLSNLRTLLLFEVLI